MGSRGFQIIVDLAERLSNKIFHAIGDYSSINIQSVHYLKILIVWKTDSDQLKK